MQRRNFNRIGEGSDREIHDASVYSRTGLALRHRVRGREISGVFPSCGGHAPDVAGSEHIPHMRVRCDAKKYLAMGGIVNWKASFDFSYMGMFIPPVPGDTTPWKRFDATSGGEPAPGVKTYTTIAQMARYASRMKATGFSTLNYFNITEFGGFSVFGKKVAYPDPHFAGAADVWTNPTAFLYDTLPGRNRFRRRGRHRLA